MGIPGCGQVREIALEHLAQKWLGFLVADFETMISDKGQNAMIFVVFFISVLTEALGPNAEVAAPLIVSVQVIAQVCVVCLVFLLKKLASSGAVARSIIKTRQII